MFSALISSPAWKAVMLEARGCIGVLLTGSFRHCWLAPRSKFTLANLHEYEATFDSYYKLILE